MSGGLAVSLCARCVLVSSEFDWDLHPAARPPAAGTSPQSTSSQKWLHCFRKTPQRAEPQPLNISSSAQRTLTLVFDRACIRLKPYRPAPAPTLLATHGVHAGREGQLIQDVLH